MTRGQRRARACRQHAPGIFGVGMPTLVLAAGVVAAVFALALALALELHWPTVADVAEAESLSGTRVLVTIGEKIEAPERQRRSSDREIPPSIEQSFDAYRLLYGQLADATFDLTVIAVAGDHPFVTASIAANLAAIAARGGRPTLLLDTDFRVQPVAKLMGIPATPGVADVLAHRIGWAGAITSVLVSRGRSIDVLPSGVLTGTLQAVTEEFSAEVDRPEPALRDRGGERLDTGAGDDHGGGRGGWRGGDLSEARAEHTCLVARDAGCAGGEWRESARDRVLGSRRGGASGCGMGEEAAGVGGLERRTRLRAATDHFFDTFAC